jgi:hypothetical protein
VHASDRGSVLQRSGGSAVVRPAADRNAAEAGRRRADLGREHHHVRRRRLHRRHLAADRAAERCRFLHPRHQADAKPGTPECADRRSADGRRRRGRQHRRRPSGRRGDDPGHGREVSRRSAGRLRRQGRPRVRFGVQAGIRRRLLPPAARAGRRRHLQPRRLPVDGTRSDRRAAAVSGVQRIPARHRSAARLPERQGLLSAQRAAGGRDKVRPRPDAVAFLGRRDVVHDAPAALDHHRRLRRSTASAGCCRFPGTA